MKNWPASFAAYAASKQGVKPLWILKLTVGGAAYYLSQGSFTITPWGVTTLPWVSQWGGISEGVNGALDEFQITDLSVSCLVDTAASPNLLQLAQDHPLEKEKQYLYLWFDGCPDAPQAFWSGYVRDYPFSAGDTLCSLQLQDESLKWQQSYVGKKVSLSDYPHADPDDVGRILPLVYGTVKKLPAVAVDAGVKTSLSAAVNATATQLAVSDPSSLQPGMVVQVDSEQCTISAVNGSTLTVVRGANGTLAAQHQKAAVVWEQKANFVYVASGHPVSSIPKVYALLGKVLLDISSICNVWPAGNHPSYPGLAVVSVPGYITIEQAVNLAIADGIVVSNGTLVSALSGNVTRTGAAALIGAIASSGSVSLSGLIALLGSVADPGHEHTTVGSSSSEQTTSSLPSLSSVRVDNLYGQGTGTSHRIVSWPADGARVRTTYNITIVPEQTTTTWLKCYVAGVAYYSNIFNWVNGSAASIQFTIEGNVVNDDVDIVGMWLSFHISAASRTIVLRNDSSNALAGVNNGTLAANNGTLNVNNTTTVGNGTLNVSDTITVDKGSLAASLSGSVSKSGTVALSGNSVANTLVADTLLVDVTCGISAPGEVISHLLTTWCNITTFRQIGELPASYRFDGAVVEPVKVIELVNRLAWQCRSWFRHHLGEALLVVRSLSGAPVKTLASCRVEGGKKQHSRRLSDYSEIINTIELLYGRDWSVIGENPYTASLEDSDEVSIDNYGTKSKPELFRFDFVTSPAMAQDLLDFFLAYYAKRHWVHELVSYYYDAALEFADRVKLAFAGDIEGQVSEMGPDPENDQVKIKVVE